MRKPSNLCKLYRIMLYCFLCLMFELGSNGQTVNGKILGIVSDPTGALLQNVKITLSNTSGFVRVFTTGEDGKYIFLNVPIGTYQIKAETQGFQAQELNGIAVSVAQELRVNVQLKVGSDKQVVNVSGAGSLVQTENSTVGTVVGERQIESLPMNGRDYTQLAALAPGVTYGGTNNWGHFVSVNGGRSEKTEFLIDGSANTETWSGGALVSPSPDAIQEFKVQSNMSPAEFGRGIGFINAATKSGTNQFHGSAYEFHRGSGMDARNYFAQTRPYLKRDQFGGALGGPIWRNKLFFYTDFEKTRLRQEVVSNVLVPSPAFKNGDFSSLSTPIIDPTTGNPFPGNQIPSDRISPIATYFQPFVPVSNAPGNQFVANTPQPTDQKQFSVRVDKQGSATNVMGRYVFGTSDQQNAFNGQVYGPDNSLGNTVMSVRTHNGSFDVTHTVTPSLLLDFRVGYYFNKLYEWSPSDSVTNRTVDSGIGGFAQTSAGLNGFPYLSIGDYAGIPGGLNLDITTKQEVQTYLASLAWSHGRHTVKAGVEYFREKGTSHHYFLSKGFFAFSGAYTGNAYADYLLGLPNYSDRSFPQALWGSTNPRTHFYLQDDWQVNSRLTVNAGVRFEFNPYPTPLRGGANFDPDLGKVVLASNNGNIDFFQPDSQAYYSWNPEWYTTSTAAGVPFSLVRAKGAHFNPRLGFAWRPFGGTNTVVRAGAGLFTLPLMGQISRGAAVVNPPWSVYEFKYAATPTPWATFWPDSTDPSGFLNPMVTGVQKDFHTAYSTQWNLTVERALPWQSSLSVGYVGNRGTHLETNVNINQPHYGPNSWSEIPFPQFGAFSQGFLSNGNSIYHSLQVQYNKRFDHGLQTQLVYSWSKNIDYTSNDQAFILDRFDMQANRGLSDLDTGHRFVGNWVYDLPIGPGKAWLNHGGWVGRVVGGWRTAGIATFQSGQPFTVLSPIDTSGFFVNGGQRADRTCSGVLSNPSPGEWFNTSCFTQAAQYTIGDSGRNILRGDGIADFDLSLLKDFKFSETRLLQLRFESFNAFNHTMFNVPNSVIGQATSGKVTSAKPARILQLGAKFYF
jgi:Carboxypeptidase regulatory-like domain/TonB-dependent Receptor Plug Domain